MGPEGVIQAEPHLVPSSLGSGTTQARTLIRSASVTGHPTESYADITLLLNEQRTYRATILNEDGDESAMSAPVSVLHDDVVAPPYPEGLEVSSAPGLIAATWEIPPGLDVAGYKLLVATSPGGPYTQTQSGLLGVLRNEFSFQAISGGTYYVAVKAVDFAGNESVPSPEVTVVVP